MYEISFVERGSHINGILTIDAIDEAYNVNYLFDIVRKHFEKFYPDKKFVIGIGKENVFIDEVTKIQYVIELEEAKFEVV